MITTSTSTLLLAFPLILFKVMDINMRKLMSDNMVRYTGIFVSYLILILKKYSIFFWNFLYPGKYTVTVDIPKVHCPRAWIHATLFGYNVLFGWLLYNVTVRGPGLRVARS